MGKEKTHWLANANKNYLGHWDLPSGKDVTLTIHTAGWETVKNPTKKKEEQEEDCRVIRFKEEYKWLKPFIFNETNAKALFKSTGEPYMEDCGGKKLRLTIRII